MALLFRVFLIDHLKASGPDKIGKCDPVFYLFRSVTRKSCKLGIATVDDIVLVEYDDCSPRVFE